MDFQAAQLDQAKAFIFILKAQPQLLHRPELSFFKEYLEGLGATIPPMTEPVKEEVKSVPTAKVPEPKVPEPKVEEPEEDIEEEEPDVPDPDLWEPDSDASQDMGDSSKKATEEESSKAMELFSEARRHMGKKEMDESITKFTEAIKSDPSKAVIYASRGDCFVRMKKPNAAIKDCDHALTLNPDQSKAFKVRGKAKRYLGQYEDAMLDLSQGNKLDWDEDTDAIIKGIKERVEKIVSQRREKQRREEVQERKRKVAEYERRKKAHEEARMRAEEEEAASDGMGGMGGMGGMPGMEGLPPQVQAALADPEVQAALQDPETSAKLMEIMSNPAAAMKYMSDPKIAKVIQKLAPLMAAAGGGAGGAPGGGFGGPPGGGFGGAPGGGFGGAPGGFGGAPDIDLDVD